MKNWYEFLTNVNDNQINVERTDTVGKRSGSMLLGYVLKTLEIAKTQSYPRLINMLNKEEGEIAYKKLETALKWAEVSKGLDINNKEEFTKYTGLEYEKSFWIPHNILSAKIYHNIFKNTKEYDEYTENLIKYHGIVGQILRGEISIDEIKSFHKDMADEYISYYIVDEMTHAVIEAVSYDLWKKVEDDADTIEVQLVDGKNDSFEYDRYAIERFKKIKPDIDLSKMKNIYKKLSRYSFWYAESVLSLLNTDDMIALLKKVIKYDDGYIKDVSFKPIADFLYYDYHGTEKRANVYKLRVIENKLKNPDDKNIIWKFNGAYEKKSYMEISCALSEACQALVDFCVKAENTKDMTYEGVTYLLMDYFKLRHDKFDRLNNENSYLQTMDDVKNSQKGKILDYVSSGLDKSVVDVGSGSGVLLNLLEEKYPNMKIIGTDISENCLDALNKKKIGENHKWAVMKHNFVTDKLPFFVDNIIFSSILHEIYSYTKVNRHYYDLSSVRNALKNAYDSLNPGGKLIIRDGVKSKASSYIMRLKSEKAYEAYNKFLYDFKGKVSKVDSVDTFGLKEHTYEVWAEDINLLREFACTYTWGPESYAVEVKEQFGYFTITQFKKELTSMGFKVNNKLSRSYLEPGYPEHLKDEIEFPEGFPNTNLIIVAEK